MNVLFLSSLAGASALGVLIGLCVPILLAFFIARFRSWFATIWFLPAFFFTFAYVYEHVPAVSNFFENSGAIVSSILLGIEVCFGPIETLHEVNVTFLSSILTNVDFYQNILTQELFPVILYDVLFVLFFLIFKKRRRKKSRKHEDDF